MHATVGEELKAARLRLGEDLQTVSGALRIRQDHLEAIEEGALDKLPGRAYALGFVRAYAEYLGLDAPGIVARFKEESGATPEPVSKSLMADETTDDARQPQGMLIALLLVFFAVLIGALYFAKSADKLLVQPSSANPPTPASEPKADLPAAAEAKPGETALPAPAQAAPAVPASVPLTGKAFGNVSGATRVRVTALRDGVWLRVEDQASGEVLISRKFQRGDHYLVPDRPNLVLVSRDGGALDLALDGVSVGSASSPGTVVDGMSLSADALAARLPPPAAALQTPAATSSGVSMSPQMPDAPVPGAPRVLPTDARPAGALTPAQAVSAPVIARKHKPMPPPSAEPGPVPPDKVQVAPLEPPPGGHSGE